MLITGISEDNGIYKPERPLLNGEKAHKGVGFLSEHRNAPGVPPVWLLRAPKAILALSKAYEYLVIGENTEQETS